ncbi:nucleoside deaminase [Methylobacterium oxalidis]|uniref:tRNA-specific adenosine deaminase n=1 Tax=Methylobacterium oxalidis TaxID=944322 RepID=A0A512IYY6_9HYPH|nr:nucleoside deaminase [Methylobacterium oxalidis]GEP02926.1 tRNA-specific adenosine deaminase [Methylobacterium oxalidis]GJE30287.1 Guanine deaminase [Methylobacterium oxalidis]GLS65859.1 tRNA-specific adenosine deaminase [Methylobacterium oxalidis]
MRQPTSEHESHIRDAVALARANADEGGSPYGAVIVRDGVVLARSVNTIHRTNDPTDHAEMVALREVSRRLGSKDLAGCIVYASGQPCPMCHAAMRLSGVREGYFAYAAEEADRYGLQTAGLYAEMCLPLAEQPMRLAQIRPEGETPPYAVWRDRQAG